MLSLCLVFALAQPAVSQTPEDLGARELTYQAAFEKHKVALERVKAAKAAYDEAMGDLQQASDILAAANFDLKTLVAKNATAKAKLLADEAARAAMTAKKADEERREAESAATKAGAKPKQPVEPEQPAPADTANQDQEPVRIKSQSQNPEPGLIILKVPATAVVTMNGQVMKAPTGSERRYHTTPIKSGEPHTYEVDVNVNGIITSRKLRVSTGETVTEDFLKK